MAEWIAMIPVTRYVVVPMTMDQIPAAKRIPA
jgi:hypothetical protein